MDWLRWEEEQDHERPNDSYATSNQKHVLPGVQRGTGDMTEPIIDEWSKQGHVAYGIESRVSACARNIPL